ncbi:uncharacterized protein [Temnothorax nylanderi]|uniref:uncharacterized protein n=1 Tax=Temnothorax nylanderi TaxID=102681 RepID=UPI003A841C68
MEVQTKWPPRSVDAGSLVRKEKPPDPNWGEETVLIKRFYDLYEKAAASCKGHVEDSNYETDNRELGRGHRIKRKVQHLDTESEKESDSGSEEFSVKKKQKSLSKKSLPKSKKTVPTPPPVPLVKSKRFLTSPHKLVRQKQHSPQLEKQSTYKTIVCKSSGKSDGKQVVKRIFNMREKMQKEKEKENALSKKICLLRSKKLQKPCKDKASLYEDTEMFDQENVDDDSSLDRSPSIEVGQNTEEELVENLNESIPLKNIPEQRFSTDTEVSASSSKDFVFNSSELMKSKPLPSLPCPAVGESSSFSDKSHANNHCSFRSETSEKSGSSCASQSKKSGKRVK